MKTAIRDSKQSKRGLSGGFQFGTIECRYFPKPNNPIVDMELVYINKGEGVCFAEGGITQFRTGELFFFSSNTAHYFKSAPQFYNPSYPLRCGATYLRFSDGILPADYLNIPDCGNIRSLVESAKQGIKWSSNVIDETLIRAIETMEEVQGFERFVRLLDILNQLGAKVEKGEQIASQRSLQSQQTTDVAYKKVIEYISYNFNRNITLEELAEHTDMNRTALCRHFKGHANRSIFDFLLSFRIEYAKQQLAMTHLPISEIAVESGFNNLPNFNVQFKRLTGSTPSEYRVQTIIK